MSSTMNSLISLIMLSCMIITCYSAVYLERQTATPGHENQCYDKENKVFYKKGEHMKWNMKVCGQKICGGSDGNEGVYTEIHTCGKIDVPSECHVEVNLHLPYPNCCEKSVCPEILYLEKNTT